MASSKETYALTAKCTLCNFQVTQEVEIEPENLVKAKTQMLKKAASIHKQHSDPKNFVIFQRGAEGEVVPGKVERISWGI